VQDIFTWFAIWYSIACRDAPGCPRPLVVGHNGRWQNFEFPVLLVLLCVRLADLCYIERMGSVHLSALARCFLCEDACVTGGALARARRFLWRSFVHRRTLTQGHGYNGNTRGERWANWRMGNASKLSLHRTARTRTLNSGKATKFKADIRFMYILFRLSSSFNVPNMSLPL
jgi:hypothetical protein